MTIKMSYHHFFRKSTIYPFSAHCFQDTYMTIIPKPFCTPSNLYMENSPVPTNSPNASPAETSSNPIALNVFSKPT